jgi:hypothetical protein
MKRLCIPAITNVRLGCDPEFFFKKNGRIVESSTVLLNSGEKRFGSEISCDGVQAELNPHSEYCRELLFANIKNNMYRLITEINEEISFERMVTIDSDTFKKMSPSAKVFGCLPSLNLYTNDISKINVNPKKSRVRCAGGHIHLGIINDTNIQVDIKKSDRAYYKGSQRISFYHYLNKTETTLNNKKIPPMSLSEIGSEEFKEKINQLVGSQFLSSDFEIKKYPCKTGWIKTFLDIEKIVYALDILLANTCVLIDRSPHNAIRRKTYGRAGEYRKTPYGLEYRVLSNFWLSSYKAFSFVFGLAREVLQILHHSDENFDYLCTLVEAKDIQNAINNNDYDLALYNFNKIIPFFKNIMGSGTSLKSDNIEKTKKLFTLPSSKLETLLDLTTPVKNYKKYKENYSMGYGWERYIESRI